MKRITYRSQAFTLVELSIVLVVLGLLVGGVLAGQSLIHAAELRRVTEEYTGYKTAFGAFKEKYLALPGDMINATRFWGARDGVIVDGIDGDCSAVLTPPVGTETCNGDGSGKYDNNQEGYLVWQHLANAGLIKGHFTGYLDPHTPLTAGLDVPASHYGHSAVWQQVGYFGTVAPGDPSTLPGDYGNSVIFSIAGHGLSGVISPQDAWNIDTKIDDGMPNNGAITPFFTYAVQQMVFSNNCITVTNDAYDLSQTGPSCILIFPFGY